MGWGWEGWGGDVVMWGWGGVGWGWDGVGWGWDGAGWGGVGLRLPGMHASAYAGCQSHPSQRRINAMTIFL